MDWSASELFVEILIAGVLFAFGISPILIRASQAGTRPAGLFPGLGAWSEGKPWIILALALVYAVGIAGNRLADELFSAVGLGLDKGLKKAEWVLRNHGEAARDWVSGTKPT